VKEIKITIFHFKNGIPVFDALFDKVPIDKNKSTWTKEKQITDNLKVVQAGSFVRESKFAVQDIYVKFHLKELNSHNIVELADFLFEQLSPIEDVDSVKINDKKIPVKKEDILQALEEYLES